MKLCATPRAKSRAILLIHVKLIQPSPYQPRRAFSDASIAALAESIRLHGLLTPLLVRRIGAGQYELIAGERRLRALKKLGCAQAEAIVLAAYDSDCALIALIENLQRENLHFLDEAGSVSRHSFRQEYDAGFARRRARNQSVRASQTACGC